MGWFKKKDDDEILPELPGEDKLPEFPELPEIGNNSTVPDLPSDLPPDLPSDLPPDLPSDLPPDLPSDLPPDLPSKLPSDDLLDQYSSNIEKVASYPPLIKPKNSSQNDVKDIISSNEIRKSPYNISTSKISNDTLSNTNYTGNDIPPTNYSTKNKISKEPSLLMKEPPNSGIKNESRSKIMNSDKNAIYIRLDKFKITKQSIEDIREKIDSMSNTLVKIKEVKDREIRELEEWENEIMIMKSKIDNIDAKIFDKIE